MRRASRDHVRRVSTLSDEVQGRHGWLRQVRIIQGGMGVAISGWRLARAVFREDAALTQVPGVVMIKSVDGLGPKHAKILTGQIIASILHFCCRPWAY